MAQRSWAKNYQKFLILYLTCCLDMPHTKRGSLDWHQPSQKVPVACHTCTQLRHPSQPARGDPPSCNPQDPQTSGALAPGTGFPSESGPPGYEDKERYSQAARGACSLSLPLSLSLSSLVTVKRHRGCNCHLCRQSVRLPKANQSSSL